jgi:hypothetical protein
MKYAVVRSSMLLMVVTLSLGPLVVSAQQATVAPTEIAKDARTQLMALPYYGVFDLLTLNVDNNNVVTLAGSVLSGALKKDAEREVREVKGAKEVHNKIAVAPLFPMDDGIRRGVYHAIYGDPSLSQYGTPDSQLRTTRPAFRGWGAGFGGWDAGVRGPGAGFDGPGADVGGLGAGFRGLGPGRDGRGFGSHHLMGAPFYGYDPIGNYAIHILVNNRTVTLAGIVNSESDKTLAEVKARGVMNVKQVNNELQVTKS